MTFYCSFTIKELTTVDLSANNAKEGSSKWTKSRERWCCCWWWACVICGSLCVGRRCLTSRAGSSGEGTSELASLPGLWLPAGRRVKGGRDKGRTECVPRGRSELGWTKSSNHHCPSTASSLPFRAENSLACISGARGRCGLPGEGGRGGVLPWVTARLSRWRVPAACGVDRHPRSALQDVGCARAFLLCWGATLTFLPRGQPTVSLSAGLEAIRARLAPGGGTFGDAGEGMEARPRAGPCPGDRDWGPTPSWPPVALSAGATQPHLAFIIHF